MVPVDTKTHFITYTCDRELKEQDERGRKQEVTHTDEMKWRERGDGGKTVLGLLVNEHFHWEVLHYRGLQSCSLIDTAGG